jgi:hypothetical protein
MKDFKSSGISPKHVGQKLEAKPMTGTLVTRDVTHWGKSFPQTCYFCCAALSAGVGPFPLRCIFAAAGLFPLVRGLFSMCFSIISSFFSLLHLTHRKFGTPV